MKHLSSIRVLALLCILAVLLSACQTQMPAPTQTTAAPTPAETTVPTQAPTQAPTTEATTVPTEPEPVYYTLTFAGDCTLGNQKGRTGSDTFIGKVKDDFAHPFLDVQEYFANDDCTFINLEGPLTDGGTPKNKLFVFRGPSKYINILTQGSVEFANLGNNHAYDYGQDGFKDMTDRLDDAGISYAVPRDTRIFTTESGLTIGVYSEDEPEDADYIIGKVTEMRAQGAEIIIAALHWGEEYEYKARKTQEDLGHALIDAGVDIVYGHHPHVLQKIEQYKDGIIYYSLGNFSFGGNRNPPDKDTALLQQQIIRHPDGSVSLGELTIIPCAVSGTPGSGNDYQPCPLEEGTTAYARVLRKLSGTYEKDYLYVSSREDLYPSKETEPSQDPTQPEQPTDAPELPTDAPELPTEAPEQPTDAPEPPTEAPEQKPEVPTTPDSGDEAA